MIEMISLVTVIIALITAVLSAFGRVPWWAFLIPVAVFVIGTAPRWVKWCITAPRRFREQRRERKLVNKYWEELRRLMVELRDATEPGGAEFAHEIFVFIVEPALPDKRDYYNPNNLKFALNYHLGEFVSLFDLQKGQKEFFLHLTNMFEALLMLWHDFLLSRARSLRKDIEQANYILNENQKDGYNKGKKEHNDFVDDFIKLRKEVNADFRVEQGLGTLTDPLPDL
ncbi:MAG: hypothetical protein V1894_03910 [Chloroflexota bacterium]